MQFFYGVPEDIEKWMSLVTQVRWNFPGLETQEKLNDHRATVLNFMGKRQAICVKDENKIAGVILFSRGHNMICCLAVAPEYRRRGIASMLMDEALVNLDRTKEISVSTFRADDEKGLAPRALYEKYGFVADELIEEFDCPNQKYVLHPAGSERKERQLAINTMVREISGILSDCEPSVYMYGSSVLNDFRLGWSDLDILVLTSKQITEEQAKSLVGLRQAMLADEPDNPYYRSFEGGMLTLDAFLSKKTARVVYWGTSGERITDSYAFDSFGMAGLVESSVLLYGKDIRKELKCPTFHELYADVKRHYETIRKYAQSTGRSFYSFGWMLDIARCIYTLRTGKIIAKTEAADWALENNLCITFNEYEQQFWKKAEQYDDSMDRFAVCKYPMSESEMPMSMAEHGFSNISTGFATIDLTPDNPKYSASLAFEMINANRQTSLDAIESVIHTMPEHFTIHEIEEMKRLANEKYDIREEQYKHGEKQWDTNVSIIMVIRGVK